MPDEVMCDLLDTTLLYRVSCKNQGNFGIHLCVNTVEQEVTSGRSLVGKKASGHLDTSKVSSIWKGTMEKVLEKLLKGLPWPLGKMKITKLFSLLNNTINDLLQFFITI